MLVIANQTVVSEELLERIRERAAKSPASFLIVAPQSDEEQHDEADKRLRRALTELRGAGHRRARPGRAPRPVHRRAARRERRARRRDHRLDVPRRAQRLAAPRPRPAAAQGHRPARRARRRPACMTAAAEAHEQHGPPPIHYSSRVSPLGARHVPLHRVGDHALRLVLHGLLLRPRGQQRRRRCLAARRLPAPGLRRGHQHADPRQLELHDALGRHVDQEGQPQRPLRRDGADVPARPHLPAHADHRVPAGSASTRATPRSPPRSSGSPACTARTCSSA